MASDDMPFDQATGVLYGCTALLGLHLQCGLGFSNDGTHDTEQYHDTYEATIV